MHFTTGKILCSKCIMSNLDSIVSPELLSSQDSSRYKMHNGVVLVFLVGFLFVVWFGFMFFFTHFKMKLALNS